MGKSDLDKSGAAGVAFVISAVVIGTTVAAYLMGYYAPLIFR